MNSTRSNGYIDLGRMFRDLTDQERADPTILAQLHELGVSGDISWDTLLESERIVIWQKLVQERHGNCRSDVA